MGFGFGPAVTPRVVRNLMLANAAVFVAQHLLWSGSAPLALMVTPALFWQHGHLWQPATYMWLHGGALHLAFNMLALWMFGADVAAHWGARRFLRFYLLCGLGAGVLIALWPALAAFATASDPSAHASYRIPTLGASGAVYGVLLAHSLLWPERRVMLLFPPIPLKALYLIPLLFLMQLGDPSVSHIGHLGGVLVGWLLLWREGVAPGFGALRHRIRRHRMRRNLRSVENDREFH